MIRVWLTRVGLCVLAGAGCGDRGTGALQGGHGRDVEVAGRIVSRVNGSAIAQREVSALARAGDLSLAAALERLQAERLLSQEAERRGYAGRARTRNVARQAQVQALLREAVERAEVSQAEVDEAYRAQRTRFEQPERRAGAHVLAQPVADGGADADMAAKAFITQTIRALQSSNDTDATLADAKGESSGLFHVVVQDLPAAAWETYVPEFSRALFSLTQPGIVPEPVHTEFGYHAVVVRQIEPAAYQPRSVAFETLRRDLAADKHKQELARLLTELRGRTPVKLAKETQKILASLDL